MNIHKELNEVAKQIGSFDERHANEVYDVADEIELQDELKGAADEVENLSKEAALLQEGDRIWNTNPTSGLFKGREYIHGGFTDPSNKFALITELDGTKVGIYDINRFSKAYQSF